MKPGALVARFIIHLILTERRTNADERRQAADVNGEQLSSVLHNIFYRFPQKCPSQVLTAVNEILLHYVFYFAELMPRKRCQSAVCRVGSDATLGNFCRRLFGLNGNISIAPASPLLPVTHRPLVLLSPFSHSAAQIVLSVIFLEA